jgi:CYTH domain-containing protein
MMIVPDLVKAVTDGQKKAPIEFQGKCFMNERTQELVSTARQQATSDTKDGKCFDVDLFHKKFAELIVGECLAKIENEAAQYNEPVWAVELVNDIKNHFGVEE